MTSLCLATRWRKKENEGSADGTQQNWPYPSNGTNKHRTKRRSSKSNTKERKRMATSVPPQNRKLLHTKMDVACTTRKKQKTHREEQPKAQRKQAMPPSVQAARERGKRRKDRLRQTPPSRTKWRRHRPRPRLGDQSRHPHPAAHLGNRDPLKGKNQSRRWYRPPTTLHNTASKVDSGLPPPRPARRHPWRGATPET